MRSDIDIKQDVESEFRRSPGLSAANIAVAVKDGVVTLVGFVRSCDQQFEAEAAAKRVAGVVGVANDLKVRGMNEMTDSNIARYAVTAIRNQLVAAQPIRAIVRDGWVTLEGEVEWNHERITAEKAVRRLKGVKGVSNLIQFKPRAAPIKIKHRIEEALRRNAEIDASRIAVEVNGGEVILRGAIRDRTGREEAERVAWSVPGVTKVDNRISISP